MLTYAAERKGEAGGQTPISAASQGKESREDKDQACVWSGPEDRGANDVRGQEGREEGLEEGGGGAGVTEGGGAVREEAMRKRKLRSHDSGEVEREREGRRERVGERQRQVEAGAGKAEGGRVSRSGGGTDDESGQAARYVLVLTKALLKVGHSID